MGKKRGQATFPMTRSRTGEAQVWRLQVKTVAVPISFPKAEIAKDSAVLALQLTGAPPL